MSPVRIWAGWGGGSGVEISLGLGAMNCAPTKAWLGAASASRIRAEVGTKLVGAAGADAENGASPARTEAMDATRVGIWGLWELPTTQVTPGRLASSSGARWA